MTVYCNISDCMNNKNWRCQVAELKLRDIEGKEFDSDIEDITISPILDHPQVEKAMLVCMSFQEKPSPPPIKATTGVF